MFPSLTVGSLSVPTFSLCVATGIAVMFAAILLRIRKCANFADECYYVLPKLSIAFGVAFVGAVVLDALFKIPQNGKFKIGGMTFYGGVLTGGATFAGLVPVCRKHTRFSPAEWLNTVTVPFLLFHFCGRIGCFLGGCCYGKVCNGFWGLRFPDQPKSGIYHYGQKVLPTQLYEAALLAVLAVAVHFAGEKKFLLYVLCYPVLRFLLEFLRGDDRGAFFLSLSPAQFLSVAIEVCAVIVLSVRFFRRRSRTHIAKPNPLP